MKNDSKIRINIGHEPEQSTVHGHEVCSALLHEEEKMYFSGISDEAGQSIEMQIKAHKELGWQYLEIRNVDNENLTLMPEKKFNEVYEKITGAGMKVSCFASCIANWSRFITGDFKVDVEELKNAIPRMQKFNTKFIRIMSWPNDEKNPLSEEEWAKEVIRRLKKLSKIAENEGVILAHENCSGWAGESPENSLRMLQEVNSPALKLIYDTGNVIHHNQDPWDFYTKVKPHIVYCHIKDYRKEGESFRATYPGEGAALIPEIIKDLLKSGYQSGVSIEPHLSSVIHEGKVGNPEVTFQTYITYGKKLMEIVKSVR